MFSDRVIHRLLHLTGREGLSLAAFVQRLGAQSIDGSGGVLALLRLAAS